MTARENIAEVLANVTAELDKMAAAGDSIEAKAALWGRALGAFAVGVGGLADAVVAWGAASAEQFQHTLDTIESFGQGSAKYMEEYKQGVINIANMTGDSTESIAQAMQRVVEANYRGAAAIQITTEAEKAAVGAHQDVAAILSPLIQTMKTWNISASDSRQAMDALLVGARNAGGEFSVLNRVLALSGDSAKQLGVSYRDLFALTDDLSAGGTKVYQSGRQVYEVMNALNTVLSSTNPTAQKLGITLSDLSDRGVHGLLPTLRAIDDAMRKGTQGSMAEYKANLTDLGVRNQALASYLEVSANHFKNLSQYIDQQKRAMDGAGATQDSFNVASQSLSHTVEQLQAQVQNLAIAIGTAFLPALSAATRDVSAIVVPFSKWVYAHQTLTQVTLGGVAAIGTFIGVIRLAQYIAQPFTEALTKINEAMVASRTAAAQAATAQTVEIASKTDGTLATVKYSEALHAERDAILSNQAARQRLLATQATLLEATAQGTAEDSSYAAGLEKVRAELAANIVESEGYVETINRLKAAQMAQSAPAPVLASNPDQLAATRSTLASTQAAQVASMERLTAEQARLEASTVRLDGLIATSNADFKINTTALEQNRLALLSVTEQQAALQAEMAITDADLALTDTALAATASETVALGVVEGETAGAMASFGTIMESIMAGLVAFIGVEGAVLVAVAALGYGIYQLYQHNETFHKSVNNLADYLSTTFIGAVVTARNSLKQLQAQLQSFGDSTSGVPGGSSIGAFFGSLGNTLGDLANKADLGAIGISLLKAAITGADPLLGPIINMVQQLHQVGVETQNAELHLKALASADYNFDHVTDSMINRVNAIKSLNEALKTQALGDQKLSTTGDKYSRGAGAVETQLEATLSTFPSDVSGMMDAVISKMNAQITAANKSYLDSVHKENQNFTDKVNQIYETATVKETTMGDNARRQYQDQVQKTIAQLQSVHQANIAALKQTLDTHVQGVRQALAQIGGNEGLVFQSIQKQAGSNQTNDLATLAAEIFKGTTNLGSFADAAAKATQIVQRLNDAQTRAEIINDERTGQFAAALSSTTQKLTGDVSNAMAKYVLDTVHHTGNLNADSEAIVRAQGKLQEYTDANAAATAIVKSLAVTFASLQQAAATAAQVALQNLAAGDMSGMKGAGLAKLEDAATTAAARSQAFSDGLATATAQVDVRMGNFAGAIQATTTQLSTNLANAQAKYAEDLVHHTGNLEQDADAIRKANDQTTKWADAQAKATAITQALSQSFSTLQQAADTKASKALDHLAKGIMDGSPHIADLTQKAFLAAQRSQSFADALTTASARLATLTGDPSGRWQKEQADAATKLSAALARASLDIEHHGAMTERDRLAIQGAEAEVTALGDIAARTAKLIAAQAPSNFDTQQKSAQDALALAQRHLNEAVLNGAASVPRLTEKVIEAQERVDRFGTATVTAAADVAKASGNWTAWLTATTNKLNTDASTAMAALVHGIMSGSDQIGHLADKVAETQERLRQYNAEVQAATIAAAKAAGDWATVVGTKSQQAADVMSQAMGRATEDVLKFGAVTEISQDRLDDAATKQEKYTLAATAATAAQAEAQRRAAVAAGDWTTALSISQKQIADAVSKASADVEAALQGNGSLPAAEAELQTAVTAQVASTINQRQAADLVTQATIRAERALGDLSDAFTTTSQDAGQKLTDAENALAEHFLTGDGNLQDLTASYLQAKAAQDALTAAQQQELAATGQWTAYMQGVTKQLGDTLANATAKLTNDFYTHSGNVEADTAAVVAAQSAQTAYTLAQWQASYATADAAGKTALLNQAFSGLVTTVKQQIQDASTMNSAEQAVTGAQSNAIVVALQGETTVLQDLTSIVSAQAAVQAASSSGASKAYQDQTAILAAQSSSQSALLQTSQAIAQDQASGNSTQLAMDQQMYRLQQQQGALQVRQAEVQLAMDQNNTRWNIKLAQDALRQADMKAAADAADAAFKNGLAQDAIKVAQDQLAVAVDNQALEALQTSIDGGIYATMSGVADYQDSLNKIMTSMSSDNTQLLTDLNRQSADAASEAQASAQAQLSIQQAALQMEQDKSSQQQDQSLLQQQLDSLARQEQQNNDQQTTLKNIEQNTSASATSDTQALAIAKAALQTQQADLLRRRMGLDRSSVVSGMGTEAYLSNFASAAYANPGL